MSFRWHWILFFKALGYQWCIWLKCIWFSNQYQCLWKWCLEFHWVCLPPFSPNRTLFKIVKTRLSKCRTWSNLVHTVYSAPIMLTGRVMSNNIRQLFVFCLWAWRKNCHVRENVPNEFYYLIIHYRTNATVSLVMVQCISMKPILSTLSSLSSPPSLSSSSLSSSVQPSTKASFIMTRAKAQIHIGQRKCRLISNCIV